MLKSSKFKWPYNNSCLRVKNRNPYYILIEHMYKGLQEGLKVVIYLYELYEYKTPTRLFIPFRLMLPPKENLL